jgi:hypothetical protein
VLYQRVTQVLWLRLMPQLLIFSCGQSADVEKIPGPSPGSSAVKASTLSNPPSASEPPTMRGLRLNNEAAEAMKFRQV